MQAQRRWRELVRARRAETERLLGAPLDASFWDARARRFAAQRLTAPEKDRRELRDLLGPWLVRRDGALAPPLRTLPAAILAWTPPR